MSKREKFFFVLMAVLMGAGSIFFIFYTIYLIANGIADCFAFTNEAVKNNPIASLILSFLSATMAYLIIYFIKQTKEIEDIVNKLNQKSKHNEEEKDITKQ